MTSAGNCRSCERGQGISYVEGLSFLSEHRSKCQAYLRNRTKSLFVALMKLEARFSPIISMSALGDR